MLREDLSTGVGCTAEQQVYRKEWSRHGVKDIYAGKIRRKHFHIFAMAKPQQQNRRYVVEPLLGNKLILPPERVDIFTFFNRLTLAEYSSKSKKIEFPCLTQTIYVDDEGAPHIGRNTNYHHKLIDFAKAPLQDHQIYEDVTGLTELTSERSGVFQVRKEHERLDLCVGIVPGSRNVPAVQYRLPLVVEELLSYNEEIREQQVIPKDSLLATIPSGTRCWKAVSLADGSPQVVHVGGRCLSATRNVRLFKVLNKLNKEQNDLTLGSDDSEFVSTSQLPNHWGWSILYEFPLAASAGFSTLGLEQYSDYLAVEFMKALGPRGDFFLRADHDGLIVRVDAPTHQPHLLKVVYVDGHIQNVPSTASLYAQQKGASSVLLGQAPVGVFAGDIIGDACLRSSFNSWDVVQSVFGANLSWIIDLFLADRSIRPGQYGWEGPGILIDYRFVTSIIDKAIKGATGQPRWYIDFRASRAYFDASLGAITPPPVLQSNWDVKDFTLGGINVHLEEPANTRRSMPIPVLPTISEEALEDSAEELECLVV